MSNKYYNDGLTDAFAALCSLLHEDVVDQGQTLIEDMMRPDPQPGEIWRELAGFYYWIYESQGHLWGCLLLENMAPEVSNLVYDGEDSLELTQKIA